MTSVTVKFRASVPGPVVTTYTTNSTSQTEFIQTDLQCATNYYITVVVTGVASKINHTRPTKRSNLVQVLVGGKDLEILCIRFN